MIADAGKSRLETVFAEVPLLTWKRSLLFAFVGVALASPALPQVLGRRRDVSDP